MAVLNKIRQRSLFLIMIIALALFSFVLADLFKNSDALTAKSQNIVATINGKDISREYFLEMVEIAQRQSGPNKSNTQVVNQVWEQELRQAIMETQYEALSISVEKDQMRDLLKTALATSQEFLNEAGVFDENKLNEYIANLKETTPERYKSWINYEKQIANNALQQSYFNLVKAGLTGTLAEGKLEHKLQGDKVDVKFVQIPYSSIADSIIVVSESDISAYIEKNKKKYEVDASRDIRFVEFKEEATIEDEVAITSDLKKLLNDTVEYNKVTKGNDSITGFLNTSDNESFVNSNSDIKFNKQFVFKSSLPKSVADSIYNLEAGGIYGPYKDAEHFKISKVVAVKQIPDSAKTRHILIPFLGARGALPEVTQTEVEAKVTADSLLSILKTDTSKFPEFVKGFSSDKGSVSNEGRYDWHPYNSMVPEFNDFEFEGTVGDLGIVKTVYGFHIVEVEGQTEKKKAIQLATLARKIEPSETTIDKIFRDASSFEVAIAEGDFEAIAKEKGYEVRPVNGVKELDENIPGVGSQRPIVRWSFESEVEAGDTKRFNIPNGYVIVQLVAVHEEGLMSVEDAKATAEPAIKKEKKAEMIRQRISATTLEDLSKSEDTRIKTSNAINIKNPTISGAGREPLIVGSAFGLSEGETSGLIDGENGVYMIQVTKFTPAVELDNYQAAANRVEQQKSSVVNTKLYNALKEAADIEDNRAKTQIQ